MMHNIKRNLILVISILVVGFLVIQLVPINRSNPPVVTQVQWDSPQTKTLFYRSCADCHSNETIWPWYSKIAPVSWLVAFDVNQGRRELNLSNLNTDPNRLSRIASRMDRTIQNGEMPPSQYLVIHSGAKLNTADKQALLSGLQATLANPVK